MLGHLFSFVIFAWLGAVIGGALSGTTLGAWIGSLIGLFVWLLIELWRAMQVMQWLGQPGTSAPVLSGVLGEVVDRVRRQFRTHERQLAASRSSLEQFLSAIQASPNGVLMLDAQWRITWCNTKAAQLLGIDPVRDLVQLIANLVRHPDFSYYLQTSDQGHDIVIDGRDHRPDHPQRISLQLFPYGEGNHLLLCQDITSIELSEAMRRDFVANVSHEIRTPLTVLSGFVETLQHLELSPEQQKVHLQTMTRHAQRMQSLVEDLLTLSRLEGSPLPGMEATPMSTFWDALQSEARALDGLLANTFVGGHEVVFDPPQVSQVEILGQSGEILSAMSNLLANALRYTQAGGRVQVSWRIGAQGEGIYSVTDNGPGIAPEHLPRITERFYRVDRSRSRETGGTGLGLAIVKHVVQRHGGELTIVSTPGQGSTFAIILPRHRVVSGSIPLAADHLP